MAKDRQAEHSVHHGGRHRMVQSELLQPRGHGLSHAEHGIASPARARCSRTSMASKPGRLAVRRSWGRQQPIRMGLTRRLACRALPGDLKAEDVTIAQVLKAQGYATGQFGKNHLGDRNEHLPTSRLR